MYKPVRSKLLPRSQDRPNAHWAGNPAILRASARSAAEQQNGEKKRGRKERGGREEEEGSEMIEMMQLSIHIH